MRKPKPQVIKALALAIVFTAEAGRGGGPLSSSANATVALALKLTTDAGYARVQVLRDLLADADATADAKLAECERMIGTIGTTPIILALGTASQVIARPVAE